MVIVFHSVERNPTPQGLQYEHAKGGSGEIYGCQGHCTIGSRTGRGSLFGHCELSGLEVGWSYDPWVDLYNTIIGETNLHIPLWANHR